MESLLILIRSFSNLLVTRTCIILWMSSNFGQIRTTDYGVSCPWASKKYPYRPYNGENGVSTFSLLFLIGSFWYFHVTRTSIKAWMSLNFLKWDLTLAHWTQVSDRCPLGYLLAHLSQRLVGELIVYAGICCPSVIVNPPSTFSNFQTTSPLKPWSRFLPYSTFSIYRQGERKVFFVPVR